MNDIDLFHTGNAKADAVIHIVAVLVVLCSAVANVVPPDTKVGQFLHWVALNFNKKNLGNP